MTRIFCSINVDVSDHYSFNPLVCATSSHPSLFCISTCLEIQCRGLLLAPLPIHQGLDLSLPNTWDSCVFLFLRAAVDGSS